MSKHKYSGNQKISDLLKMDLPIAKKMNTNFIWIFCEQHNISTYDLDYEAANKHIVEKIVYDHHHDSDEECYFYLIYLDGDFVATQTKAGDRTDTTFNYYNDGEYKLHKHMCSFFHVKYESKSIDDIVDINNMYLYTFVDSGYLYYYLVHPKSGFGFNKDRETFIFRDNNAISCTFIKFVNNVPSFRDEDQICIINVNGKSEEISAKEIAVRIGKIK